MKHLPLFFDSPDGGSWWWAGPGRRPQGSDWRARPAPRSCRSRRPRRRISTAPSRCSSRPAISRARPTPAHATAKARRRAGQRRRPARRSATSSCRPSSTAMMWSLPFPPAARRPPWRRCCAAGSRRCCPSGSARSGRPRPTFRRQANALIARPADRRAFWRRLVEGPAARLALAGDDISGARRVALSELNDARREQKPCRHRAYRRRRTGRSRPSDPPRRAAAAGSRCDPARRSRAASDPRPRAARCRARAVGKRKGRRKLGAARYRGRDDPPRARRPDGRAAEGAAIRSSLAAAREEVDALRAAGLPVSVVPGITAALGIAAATNIPLTDRRIASSVTFSRAMPRRNAGGGHTYVIYMGAIGSRFRARSSAGRRHCSHNAGRHRRERHAARSSGSRPAVLADLARLALPHTAQATPVPASSSSARWRHSPSPPTQPRSREGVLMAKNLTGDLQVASANRLTDGVVVFLDDAASGPGSSIARRVGARQARRRDPARARQGRSRKRRRSLPGRRARGRRRHARAAVPARKNPRFGGLTFEAIAAEAVRYA